MVRTVAVLVLPLRFARYGLPRSGCRWDYTAHLPGCTHILRSTIFTVRFIPTRIRFVVGLRCPITPLPVLTRLPSSAVGYYAFSLRGLPHTPHLVPTLPHISTLVTPHVGYRGCFHYRLPRVGYVLHCTAHTSHLWFGSLRFYLSGSVVPATLPLPLRFTLRTAHAATHYTRLHTAATHAALRVPLVHAPRLRWMRLPTYLVATFCTRLVLHTLPLVLPRLHMPFSPAFAALVAVLRCLHFGPAYRRSVGCRWFHTRTLRFPVLVDYRVWLVTHTTRGCYTHVHTHTRTCGLRFACYRGYATHVVHLRIPVQFWFSASCWFYGLPPHFTHTRFPRCGCWFTRLRTRILRFTTRGSLHTVTRIGSVLCRGLRLRVAVLLPRFNRTRFTFCWFTHTGFCYLPFYRFYSWLRLDYGWITLFTRFAVTPVVHILRFCTCRTVCRTTGYRTRGLRTVHARLRTFGFPVTPPCGYGCGYRLPRLRFFTVYTAVTYGSFGLLPPHGLRFTAVHTRARLVAACRFTTRCYRRLVPARAPHTCCGWFTVPLVTPRLPLHTTLPHLPATRTVYHGSWFTLVTRLLPHHAVHGYTFYVGLHFLRSVLVTGCRLDTVGYTLVRFFTTVPRGSRLPVGYIHTTVTHHVHRCRYRTCGCGCLVVVLHFTTPHYAGYMPRLRLLRLPLVWLILRCHTYRAHRIFVLWFALYPRFYARVYTTFAVTRLYTPVGYAPLRVGYHYPLVTVTFTVYAFTVTTHTVLRLGYFTFAFCLPVTVTRLLHLHVIRLPRLCPFGSGLHATRLVTGCSTLYITVTLFLLHTRLQFCRLRLHGSFPTYLTFRFGFCHIFYGSRSLPLHTLRCVAVTFAVVGCVTHARLPRSRIPRFWFTVWLVLAGCGSRDAYHGLPRTVITAPRFLPHRGCVTPLPHLRTHTYRLLLPDSYLHCRYLLLHVAHRVLRFRSAVLHTRVALHVTFLACRLHFTTFTVCRLHTVRGYAHTFGCTVTAVHAVLILFRMPHTTG